MKKRKVFIFLGLLVFFIIFSGCKNNVYTICKKEISETRTCYYFGKNDEFVASVTSGEREEEYILNGEHTKNIPYTVLVVDFLTINPSVLPNYDLNIGGKIYSGEMEFNPFNNTFCVDLGVKIEDNLDIELSILNSKKPLDLISISSLWQVDYDLAFDIAINAFGDRLYKYIENGKLQGELFQKLVSLNRYSAEDIYWNICLFLKNGEILTCTINVITGQVVAM